MNINKPFTTDLELTNFARAARLPLVGVFSKDEIPERLHDGGYIINLDDSAGAGTHWTAFFVKGQCAIYVDSFGQPPPLEVLRALRPYKLEVNKKIIQNPSSGYCGAFVIVFIWVMAHNFSLAKFQRMWSADIEDNRRILQYYIAINT